MNFRFSIFDFRSKGDAPALDAGAPVDLARRSTIGNRRLQSRARGLGLAELLIALSISASVLAAVGVAVDASFKAYKINQEQSSITQRARLVMHRIVSTIRATKEHAPIDASLLAQFAAGATVTGTGIQMYDNAGALVEYRLDADSEQLSYEINGDSHVLCQGVTAFTVRVEPMRSSTSLKTGGGWDLLKRATIQLTVRASESTMQSSESTGLQTTTMSCSVMPRRNVW